MKIKNVWKRFTAAALCLCMWVADLPLPALAAEGDVEYTDVYVQHVYLNSDMSVWEEGQIYPFENRGRSRFTVHTDGDAMPSSSESDFDEKSGFYGCFIVPQEQTYYDDTFAAYVTEQYTGYEIAAGNEAVEFYETGGHTSKGPHFEVTYKSNVQNVILYLFYSYDGRTVLGADFGADLEGVVDAGEDVLLVTEDNKEAIIRAAEEHKIVALQAVEVGDVIYNTGTEGLHTEKRVSADVLEDGRTFDVSLESWYTADSNAADVGFILDSSGSMAFVPNPTSAEDGLTFVQGDQSDSKKFNKLSEDGYSVTYMALPSDELFVDGDPYQTFMNPGNTDNSPLAYTGYSYYVFDSRESVNELVPLAYWDGTMKDATNPMKIGLVGMYQFDRTQEGSTRPYFLKNGATGDINSSSVVGEHSQSNNDYKSDNNSGVSVTPAKGSLQLYSINDDSPFHSTLDLDAKVTDPKNFTISFAVRTDGTGAINADLHGSGGPQAEDLVTIKGADGNVLYTILRGTAGSGNSQNHVRWQKSGDTTHQHVNLSYALGGDASEQKYTNYSANAWRVFTYVVENGIITAYVDGAPADVTEELDLGDGPLSFTLGGSDRFVSGPTLQIDEVYIYDGRALSADDVSELVNTMNTPADNVTDPVADKSAVVGGTEMNLYDYTNFNSLAKDARAGWYYVNSIGDYTEITAADSAKSLHGLTTRGDSKYPETMGGRSTLAVKSGDGINGGNTITGGAAITQTSPCLFYFADADEDTAVTKDKNYSGWNTFGSGDVILHCIFSPSSGTVLDSPVFVKQSNTEMYTKAQKLQVALNTFINRLRVNSSESRVSAVRFSSETYGTHPDELLLQTWTNDPAQSTGMMNLSRGDDVEAGMAKATDNAGGLYNYVITGGTCAYTGLQAFITKLADDTAVTDDDAGKYLVLFTDGQDDELDDAGKAVTDTRAVALAEQLREDYDYTIFTVRLVSGDKDSSGEGGARAAAFLQAIAGNDDNYFEAATADDLEDVFARLIDEMPFKLTGYTVKDYIDPRFDLVADTVSDPTSPDAVKTREIVHLHEDGVIHIGKSDGSGDHYDLKEGGQDFYFSTAEKKEGEEGYTERYTRATLYYDTDKGLYYLEWVGQNIPLSRKGTNSLSVWSAVVTLRAKEDFIGGNAVLTNGPESGENLVYHPVVPDDTDDPAGTADPGDTAGADGVAEDFPFKSFPRTEVNVKPYRMTTDPTVDVRYLGDTLNPKDALKGLFGSASGEIQDLDNFGGIEDMDAWKNRDGSGYYYEYAMRYLQANPGAYTGETLDEDFGKFLDDILASPEGVTLNYSFLPAVAAGEGHEHGTQTGGEPYQGDVMGSITYKWEAVHGDGFDGRTTDSAPARITDKTPKRYMLTVAYAPADVAARRTEEEKLFIDTEFKTGIEAPKAKAPVGEAAVAPTPAKAVHTTYVVNGELAVKVRAPASALKAALEDNGGTLTLTAEVTRPFVGDFNEQIVCTVNSADVSSDSGMVDLYFTGENLQGLPMGYYRIRLASGTNALFADLSPAADACYTADTFPGGAFPTGDDAAAYIASGGQNSMDVGFYLGGPAGGVGVDSAAMAQNLAQWVDKQLEGTLRTEQVQDELNAKALDPTVVPAGEIGLKSELYARLGMAEAGVLIDPPVTLTLKTRKTLTVENGPSAELVGFTFRLTPDAHNPSGDPVPHGGRTAAVTFGAGLTDTSATADVVFGALEYSRPGTYTYTLAEETADDDTAITYDDRAYTVTVTIDFDGTTTVAVDDVSVTPTADGERSYTLDLSETAPFANTYTVPTPPTPVDVTLTAHKILDGGAPAENLFDFRLQSDGGTSLTAQNDAAGNISFEAEYTAAGTYTYTLFEQPGSGNYLYDNSEHRVVVTVTEADGSLAVDTVTLDDAAVTPGTPGTYDLGVTFANETVAAPGQAYITGTKLFANEDGRKETFTFRLEAGEFTPAAAPAMAASLAAPEAEAAADALTLPETETLPAPEAASEVEVAFETEAAPETEVVPEPEVSPAPDAVPEPEVLAQPDMGAPILSVPGVPKEESGIAPLADTPDFPMPADAQVTTDGSGVFRFGPIQFEQAGTYTYTVSEVPGTAADIYYDKSTYQITFTVTEDSSGVLQVAAPTVTMDGAAAGGSLLFLNAAISKASAQDGETVEENGSILYNVSWANFTKTGADVAVRELFDPGVDLRKVKFIGAFPDEFEQDDNQYTWTFAEVEPGDAGAMDITVRVNEDAALNWDYVAAPDGTLKAELAEGLEAVPTVHNQASVTCNSITVLTQKVSNVVQLRDAPFTPPTADPGDLTISKTVVGADTDEAFDFTVLVADADGDYQARKENGAAAQDASVHFTGGMAQVSLKDGESITILDLPAGALYTVTETKAEGYTAAFTGESGSIPGGGEAKAAFTNTKQEPTPPTQTKTGSLQVTKTVTGAGDTAQYFAFDIEVAGANGAYAATGDYSAVTFADGKATLHLKHGGSVTVSGLPADARYTVTEAPAEGYTVRADNASGTIPADGTVTAAFVNDKPAPDQEPEATPAPGQTPDNTPGGTGSTPPRTGDDAPLLLWLAVLVASGAGLAVLLALLIRKKRR